MSELAFTDDNFQAEAIDAGGVVLVDFFATWCGPCKMLAPVVEELVGEYEGKAKVGKLDVDANSETAGKFGVQSIPTIIIFKDGKEFQKLIGFQSKEVLKEHLDNALQ